MLIFNTGLWWICRSPWITHKTVFSPLFIASRWNSSVLASSRNVFFVKSEMAHRRAIGFNLAPLKLALVNVVMSDLYLMFYHTVWKVEQGREAKDFFFFSSLAVYWQPRDARYHHQITLVNSALWKPEDASILGNAGLKKNQSVDWLYISPRLLPSCRRTYEEFAGLRDRYFQSVFHVWKQLSFDILIATGQ